MIIGYVRDDEAGAQKARLERAGCRIIMADLDAACARLARGDTLVVTSADRLDLKSDQFAGFLSLLVLRKDANLRILDDRIDTAGPFREYLATLLSSISSADKKLKLERRVRGARKAHGKRTGRPRHVSANKFARAEKLVRTGKATVRDVAALLGVSRQTYYNYKKYQHENK